MTEKRISSWWFPPVAAFSLTLLLILFSLVWEDDERVSLRVVGPEEVVFDWSEQACEPEEIPDIPAKAFRDSKGRVQLLAFNHTAHRMIGPDLNSLDHDCSRLIHSHREADPGRFDDLEWITSVYALGRGKVVALIHNEYRGDAHPGHCPSGKQPACWFNSITLAVSSDDGDSYVHRQAPDHLVAALADRYRAGEGPAGIFSPSNIVFRPSDGFYYVLFRIIPYRGRRGISAMRTRDLEDPSSWRAWDGREFSIRFGNPYRKEGHQGATSAPHLVSPSKIGEMSASLTYNTHLDRFLLVGPSREPASTPGEWQTGFYFSLSKDLVHWSPRRKIFEVESPGRWRAGDEAPLAYPSLLDPESSSRNFETTGKRNYLYFVRFNLATSEDHLDRDLIRVPVEFD